MAIYVQSHLPEICLEQEIQFARELELRSLRLHNLCDYDGFLVIKMDFRYIRSRLK